MNFDVQLADLPHQQCVFRVLFQCLLVDFDGFLRLLIVKNLLEQFALVNDS